MMLSLGLLTACGSSGGSDSGSGDPGPSTGEGEDPKEDDPKEGTNDLDSLPPSITKEASENQRLALTIPEYKNTNSYAFTGVDAAEVEQLLGEVVFKEQPDFETKNTYSFIMTVTNAEEQNKNIDVTINITNVIEEFDSLPGVISENVNENSRFALAIPEYKDTNSYVFSGVDGDKVKLWAERGEVIFNYAPDFETQASYNFIMTVTSATESVKEIDVTLDINDVSNAFIFEVLAGSVGTIDILLNDGQHETQYDTYSFTVKRDDEVAQEFNNLGTFSYLYIPLVETEDALAETQRFTITPDTVDGLPAFRFNANQSDSDVKINIVQWGDNSWATLEEMLTPLCDENRNTDSLFFAESHDSPNLSRVKNADGFFINCNLRESLSYWDVSSIENMNAAFIAAKGNTDLSQWDVSSVNNMRRMFEIAKQFNSDLSAWNVSSVADMESMFFGAEVFSSNLSLWVTSSVKNMTAMFGTTKAFNSDISQWNTSLVEDMSFMFYKAELFDQDISGWSVDMVTNCEGFKRGALLRTEFIPINLAACGNPLER